MKSINQATLLGNLTRDPELKYTPGGSAVINFSIATNSSYKDKQTDEWKDVAEYHNVVFWGKPAEIISQYCAKGDKLLVQGRMQTRSWEGQDGVKKYTTEIIGKDFILLTAKSDSAKKVSQPVEAKKEPQVDTDAAKKAEEFFGGGTENVEITVEDVEGKKVDDGEGFIEGLEKDKAERAKKDSE